MYIFKKDKSVVDNRGVNMIRYDMVWKCVINEANVWEDPLCQVSTRPTNAHIQIFSHLEMDECEF